MLRFDGDTAHYRGRLERSAPAVRRICQLSGQLAAPVGIPISRAAVIDL